MHTAEPIEFTTRALFILGAPAVGPVVVTVLGYNVPVLSAALALVGVLLAAMLAPPPPRPLSTVQRVALMILLSLLAVALAIGGTTSPVVSLCWAIGIGYSGLPFIVEIQRIVFNRAAQLAGPGIKTEPEAPIPDPEPDVAPDADAEATPEEKP